MGLALHRKCRDRRPRAARLRPLRGRVVEDARARRRDRGLPAALDGLRIATSLRFPPRRALAGPGRHRACGCLGGRAAAGPSSASPATSSRILAACRFLTRLLGTLDHPFVVLGNHDVAVTRDPFSRAAELDGLEGVAILLRTEAVAVERRRLSSPDRRRRRRELPEGTARPWKLVDPAADLRILLCHFPDVDRKLPPGSFHLVLAGHLHAGQIAIPSPRRRITLAHPSGRFVAASIRRPVV